MSSRTRRTRLGQATAATVAGVSLLATACGGTDVTEAANGGEAAETGQEQAAPTGPVLDPSVLTGEAMTTAGGSFDLGTLADKDLVVWFWAPW